MTSNAKGMEISSLQMQDSVHNSIDTVISNDQSNNINNIIFFELFGICGFYSINYERLLKDYLVVRIGYSRWSFSGVGKATLRYGIPFNVSYILGKEKTKVEIGIGIQYMDATEQPFLLDARSYQGLYVFGIFGLRFQPREFGEFYRICVTGLSTPFNFKVSIGISGGVCF
jgi:hypothetical protein